MDAPDPSPHATDAVPTAEELQRAIASVPGVTSAEVSRASNGRDRLRISLGPGEDPEGIAWSVAATLRERFGIALDPAAISARAIADPSEDPVRVISRVEPAPAPREPVTWPPLGEAIGDRPDTSDDGTSAVHRIQATGASDDEPAGPAGPTGPQASADLLAAARAALDDGGPELHRNRAAISELTALPDGDDLAITATLRLSGREVVGRAHGVRTRRGRWRAISEATLDALGPLSADRVRGHVDHVTVLSYADLAHVSVAVTLLTDRGEESFLGAALVRDDPDRAVMRATLDAVNRRVEPWLAAAPDVSEAG